MKQIIVDSFTDELKKIAGNLAVTHPHAYQSLQKARSVVDKTFPKEFSTPAPRLTSKPITDIQRSQKLPADAPTPGQQGQAISNPATNYNFDF